MIRIYKYSAGSGNFIMVDGRDVEVPRFRKPAEVHSLCLIHQADGLVILDHSAAADFKMEFRGSAECPPSLVREASACAVAYADLLGVKPFHTQDYTFEIDGTVHAAVIASHLGECKEVSLSGAPSIPCLCLGELE